MPLKAALPGGFCMTASVTFKFSLDDVTNRLTIEHFYNRMKAVNLCNVLYVLIFNIIIISINFIFRIKGGCEDD